MLDDTKGNYKRPHGFTSPFLPVLDLIQNDLFVFSERQLIGIYRYTAEKARSIIVTHNTYLVQWAHKGDLMCRFTGKEVGIQKASSNACNVTEVKFSEVSVSVSRSLKEFLETSFINQSQ